LAEFLTNSSGHPASDGSNKLVNPETGLKNGRGNRFYGSTVVAIEAFLLAQQSHKSAIKTRKLSAQKNFFCASRLLPGLPDLS
jgi:hypothetical protein